MDNGKHIKTSGNFNRFTMIAVIVLATLVISGIGYYTIFYNPPPSGPPTLPATSPANIGKETDSTIESTETTFGPTNTTFSETEQTANTTDTELETPDPTEEVNTTKPVSVSDSAIITMNVSDLHDLYINASFRYDRQAKAKIENLTGKVIRVRGVFRVSARKKAEDNQTYELVILFGTADKTNPKDIFIYLPFTEEVLRATASVKYPDTVVVQGEFYPGPPEPLPFRPSVLYNIFGRLNNCQLVP